MSDLNASMAFNFVKNVLNAFYSKLYPKIDFRRKAVFITGCDSGLGYNFALHLHSKGVKVFAGVYNRLSPGAVDLGQKNVRLVQVDVTNSESVVQASKKIKEDISATDCDFLGLVNNAGVMIIGEFEWQTEEMLTNQLSVNLLGPMRTIKHFLPLLRQHNGRIVNVSSHCAAFPLPGMAPYSASKAALRAFSLGLHTELSKFGIKVVELVPGSFIMHSCIMSNQKQHSSTMSANMSDEVKQVYKDYFERYADYLSSLPVPDGTSPPRIIDDVKLFDKLESAIFSYSPRSLYINEPPRYFLYYKLFSLLPQCSLRDYLVNKFIRMPEWNEHFNK